MIERGMAGKISWKNLAEGLVPLSKKEVVTAYRSWAPVYDWTFGMVARAGRNAAISRVNRLGGRLLEVGVGTGLSLPRYSSNVEVVGLDLSPHMLKQAQKKVETEKLDNVVGLSLMDASTMAYADNSFDIVTAMYVMTVAPDPSAVFAELCRVVRPGGEIILVNHFSHEKGWRSHIERLFAPHAAWLGWRPEFPLEPFIGTPGLTLTNSRELAPFGLFTMLCFRKDDVPAVQTAIPSDVEGATYEDEDEAVSVQTTRPVSDNSHEIGSLVSAMPRDGGA